VEAEIGRAEPGGKRKSRRPLTAWRAGAPVSDPACRVRLWNAPGRRPALRSDDATPDRLRWPQKNRLITRERGRLNAD